MADIRDARLATWTVAVQRTSTVVVQADGVDSIAITIARALAAADDESGMSVLLATWRRADFGALSAASMAQWFAEPGAGLRAGAAEAVAWYCQPFAVAGWVDVDRLDADDWQHLQLDQPTRFSGRSWTRTRLEHELPPPSLVVDRRIYCYAPADPLQQWAFFELAFPTTPPWRDGSDGPLRSVRVPGGDTASQRVVLTPEGRLLATHHLLPAVPHR